MRRMLLVTSMALAAACGPASVSGTVGGASIDSSDAIAEKTSIPVLGDALHVVIGGDSEHPARQSAHALERQVQQTALPHEGHELLGETLTGKRPQAGPRSAAENDRGDGGLGLSHERGLRKTASWR